MGTEGAGAWPFLAGVHIPEWYVQLWAGDPGAVVCITCPLLGDQPGPLTPVLKEPKPLWPLPTSQESFPLTLVKKHELEVAGYGKFVLTLNLLWFAPNHPYVPSGLKTVIIET